MASKLSRSRSTVERKKKLIIGQWFGSVGRAVASETRGVWFICSPLRILYRTFVYLPFVKK